MYAYKYSQSRGYLSYSNDFVAFSIVFCYFLTTPSNALVDYFNFVKASYDSFINLSYWLKTCSFLRWLLVII